MRASQLNPHQKPPEYLRVFYKRYQKLDPADLGKDPDLIDFSSGLDTRHTDVVHCVQKIDATTAYKFLFWTGEEKISDSLYSPIHVYEHAALPGGLVTAL